MTTAEQHRNDAPDQIWCRVLTVSDTRNAKSDRSGTLIMEALEAAGRSVTVRRIVRDDPLSIQREVIDALGDENCDALIITGGTGIAPRDVTFESVEPFLSTEIPGFGELFRMLSYEEIGSAAMLSRAFAGVAGDMLIIGLPGSPNAVKLAMDKLVIPELGHLVGQLQTNTESMNGSE